MPLLDESARAPQLAPTAPDMPPANGPLQKLLADQLQFLLSAEQQLTVALPKMQAAATSAPLRDSFGKHLGETQQQAVRLEKALQILGPVGPTCDCTTMKALIAEGENGIANTPAGTATRDASLVLSAQRIEHYEIAAYGGLIEIAKMLGYREIAGLLYASLTEEKGADKALTLVGEGGINYSAAKEG